MRGPLSLLATLLVSAAWGGSAQAQDDPTASTAAAPTAVEARRLVAHADARFRDLAIYVNKAAWVNATYITPDTDWLAAKSGAEATRVSVLLAKDAARLAQAPGLDFDTRRQLDILRQGLVLPAPTQPGAAERLSQIATRLQSSYGKGRGLYRGKSVSGNDLEALMGTVRNPDELREMWVSWHAVGRPMRQDYTQMVAIANAGARELGYSDTGAMWRAAYDMPPEDFTRMTDALWGQVKPLYDALHCYTRARLNARYGDAVQPATGPIRADLLGNMWGQEWGNIYDIVAPEGIGGVGYDLTALLKAKNYDPLAMVKRGEAFYTSLGLAPLPPTFWTRSQITAPRDREVVCHASAWNIDGKDDLRIKMCTRVNAQDFITIHHELGHNYYQRAYNHQPYLYQAGANDGFHEAIGDFIALSMTPDYLVDIGLLDQSRVPDASKDIGLLLRQAMDKVAFLPFGLLVDKWRWGVFSGEITPDDYNRAWTDLRRRYQGIVPPVPRRADDFDPGAKYHIPGNTPYMRYFLARLLQFQFYRAACDQAGWTGPLHRCSFYGKTQVGTKLNAMMAMGASRPWPEALESFTGQRQIDAGAMVAYFQPLMHWLAAQNKGQQCGWAGQ